ncbi:hypothetical protein [Sinosporangium siamense]|uniref:Hydrophobic W protein n=1 Tax=Sinosporangium siamense TaxID=1367973 RepID=A0A919RSJ3_9ACTN|nr:hypothetical protein [Sinosporangium siamense]GII97494.1 hypothetical protein Ssi02_77250 [Sinosporangium siamense]
MSRLRTFGMVVVSAILVGVAGAPPASADPASADPGEVRQGVVDAAKSAPALDERSLARAQAEVVAAVKERRASTSARVVCYRAHVQDIGWQSVRCDGQVAGTTGQSRRLEALTVAVSIDVGGVCYQAHVQDIGWQSVRCNGQVAGTTGQSLRLEALAIAVSSGNICYRAHVQDIGWQSVRCNGQVAGTTGQSLRLEAISITV